MSVSVLRCLHCSNKYAPHPDPMDVHPKALERGVRMDVGSPFQYPWQRVQICDPCLKRLEGDSSTEPKEGFLEKDIRGVCAEAGRHIALVTAYVRGGPFTRCIFCGIEQDDSY